MIRSGQKKENNIKNRIYCHKTENTYDSSLQYLRDILEELETSYTGMRKGIFVSNDTHANILLNLIVRKYGRLPDDYYIIGFDDSPVAREAVIPISTIGQQIDRIANEAVSLLVSQMNERKKRKPAPLKEPVHKTITPILIRRETTEKENLPENR